MCPAVMMKQKRKNKLVYGFKSILEDMENWFL